MQTIIINSETLAELKTGKVTGVSVVSVEMAAYIEEKNIISIEIFPGSKLVILTDSIGDHVCDFGQTIFDYTIY